MDYLFKIINPAKRCNINKYILIVIVSSSLRFARVVDSRRQSEMYIGRARLSVCVCVCVCVCLSVCPSPHSHTTARTRICWGNGRGPGVPFSCTLLGVFAIGVRVSNTKCQRVLVLALCLVSLLFDEDNKWQFSVQNNLIMVTLWNRADHFCPVVSSSSSSFFLA